MKNFRRIMQFAAIALAVSNVSAAEIKEIRFGVEPGYAPFEVKAADGSLAGFDIDLGNEMVTVQRDGIDYLNETIVP